MPRAAATANTNPDAAKVTPRRKRIQRQRKRFQVRFDSNEVVGAGFTGNVSPAGMLIHSKRSTAPGTILRGQIFLPGDVQTDFQAEVRWVHRQAGPLAQLIQGSMGLKFIVPPHEAYFQLLLKPDSAT